MLLQVFACAGVAALWMEWDRKSPESPVHIRGYGSPTILVNGKGVANVEPGNGEDCCRLYPDGAHGCRGIPAVDHIVVALTQENHGAVTTRVPFGWRRRLAVVQGVGASLLPVASCPACWLSSTGLLTSVGLGFLTEETSPWPVTVALLGVALVGLVVFPLSSGGFGRALIAFVSFALAMGGLMMLLTVFVGLSKRTLLQQLIASTTLIQKVSGVILILIGLYVGDYFLQTGM
jgi:hypothetical protein